MAKNPSRLERRILKRDERSEQIARQRERFRARERNKRIINYTILGVVLLAVGYALWALLLKPAPPGQHDALAACLSERGVVMYGTEWCPHCQDQKRAFGSSFRYVTYVNCDLSAAACQAAGVTGYPTWVFPGGESLAGKQELSVLAERSGCTA